ncbi:hypothetical protein LT722_06495 [Pseudomonas syringae pv. syringae]|uniref:hypothetical protein n=1 Tax=Pseudomonas syringae TaxID=317 RepID=UPI00200B2EB6|nr:hypothetical protein [Pseudomonas syringae]MCK9715221.1 hypothetical protein [Pseudomonas syringae pv. syringae]MCK9761303.1 hypothetical protein [Pseudomonas syringae pv. syringae]
MSSTENDFTKIKKEQLALKSIEFDDLDIDNMSFGPVETPSAVQQHISDLKAKPVESLSPARNRTRFELDRDDLRKTINLYDDDIVKTIDNHLSFMPVEQNFSSSYIMEIIRTQKKKDSFDPAMISALRPEIERYFAMLDSRYSLFRRTLLTPDEDNPHYAQNLHFLDQAYLKNGFSYNKCSVLTPFHVMELFSGKNLKKYHLASLIVELEEDRLPPAAGVDSHLPQL